MWCTVDAQQMPAGLQLMRNAYFRAPARLWCAACHLWRTQDGPEPWDQHDRCIRRLPGVNYACCGHGRRKADAGYISAARGVLRFPGDVHPLLVRAAVGRYLRTGSVPGFARQDNMGFTTHVIALGCRFSTVLDRKYRRWIKRRSTPAITGEHQ